MKIDNNDYKNGMSIDEGQGFMDRNIFHLTETDFNRLGPIYAAEMKFDRAWIPGAVRLKDIDERPEKSTEIQQFLNDESYENTQFDIDKNRVVKTIASNEVESKEVSTANEEENDPRLKRSKKLPTRYLNYELD